MGPHKNPVDAIGIARAAGMPIVLAGRPQTSGERDYFAAEVEPLLREPGVEYVGEITHDEKVELLGGASALLFPIRWDEHFGLVMIEAMACGTPVLAYPRGSVPEVVDYGATGFWADSRAGLEKKLAAAMDLDRQSVRDRAHARFGVERMARDYVQLYRSLAPS
jgi:glycosyltransferase involved in cell wall biosynthesis